MADVPTFAMFLMREQSPLAVDDRDWLIGDAVRAFIPSQSMIDNPGTAQPRKSVLVITGVNLTQQQWDTLKPEYEQGVTETVDPPPEDPEGEPSEEIVINRVWWLPFTPEDNEDLDPAGRGFMQALLNELNTPPYGASRAWPAIENTVLKNKVSGKRNLPQVAVMRQAMLRMELSWSQFPVDQSASDLFQRVGDTDTKWKAVQAASEHIETIFEPVSKVDRSWVALKRAINTPQFLATRQRMNRDWEALKVAVFPKTGIRIPPR